MFIFLGLRVTTPDGVTRQMRCILLLSAVDLPARSLLLNMKQFNGKHGCCYCNREGEVRPGCPLHRFCPPSVGTLQTYASMIQNAKEAQRLPRSQYIIYTHVLILNVSYFLSKGQWC